MIVLDTDHMSILERRGTPAAASLLSRLAGLSLEEEVVTTIITYEEQMRGWMAYLARTRSVPQQIEAYQRLIRHVENYRHVVVVPFDEPAGVEYQRLRRARIRIGTMDLKIAATVLSRNGLLLSRNRTDFGRVPGLQVENWT